MGGMKALKATESADWIQEIRKHHRNPRPGRNKFGPTARAGLDRPGTPEGREGP
jgi:hypothetical protein